MPLVQVYKCPRTRNFFEQKSEYLVHLKKLARQSLDQKKAKKRTQAIATEFASLRKNARSFEDIQQWLLTHAALLSEVTPAHRKPNKPVKDPVVAEFTFSSLDILPRISARDARPLHDRMHAPKTGLPKLEEYPGVRGRITHRASEDISLDFALTEFLGVRLGTGTIGSTLNRSGSCDFRVLAEDWPFLGAQCLYHNWTSVSSDAYKRILAFGFPGITYDMFTSMRNAGLFPDNKEEFCAMMYGFIESKATWSNEPLPVTLTLDSTV